MELNAIYKQSAKRPWQSANIGLKCFNCGIKGHFKRECKVKPQRRNIGGKKGGYRPPPRPKQLNGTELPKVPHEQLH
jgi:hypothetical protein